MRREISLTWSWWVWFPLARLCSVLLEGEEEGVEGALHRPGHPPKLGEHETGHAQPPPRR